jgi:hypothetical protein
MLAQPVDDEDEPVESLPELLVSVPVLDVSPVTPVLLSAAVVVVDVSVPVEVVVPVSVEPLPVLVSVPVVVDEPPSPLLEVGIG